MKEEKILLKPETYYHIYNRGNNKEVIFKEQKNYAYFMTLVEKHILPVADLFAYNLLPNHFHLFIKTKNIPASDTNKQFSQPFSNLFNAYAKAINKSYNRTGSLFQEKFRRKEVNSDQYFTSVVLYIHGNAQHHGLVKDFKQHPYTSYHNYVNNTYNKLEKNGLLEWFGGLERFIKMHEEYKMNLDDRKIILENIDDD
jgi:REP element-mobilizing transposase RayT